MLALTSPFLCANERIEPDPKRLLEALSIQDNAQDVYQGLLNVRKESILLEKWLINENSYRPDEFFFATTINTMLEDLPSDFEMRPSCASFMNDLLHGFRLQTPDELPELEQYVYAIYEKTCS